MRLSDDKVRAVQRSLVAVWQAHLAAFGDGVDNLCGAEYSTCRAAAARCRQYCVHDAHEAASRSERTRAQVDPLRGRLLPEIWKTNQEHQASKVEDFEQKMRLFQTMAEAMATS